MCKNGVAGMHISTDFDRFWKGARQENKMLQNVSLKEFISAVKVLLKLSYQCLPLTGSSLGISK